MSETGSGPGLGKIPSTGLRWHACWDAESGIKPVGIDENSDEPLPQPAAATPPARQTAIEPSARLAAMIRLYQLARRATGETSAIAIGAQRAARKARALRQI
jgi:hypothetical protein